MTTQEKEEHPNLKKSIYSLGEHHDFIERNLKALIERLRELREAREFFPSSLIEFENDMFSFSTYKIDNFMEGTFTHGRIKIWLQEGENHQTVIIGINRIASRKELKATFQACYRSLLPLIKEREEELVKTQKGRHALRQASYKSKKGIADLYRKTMQKKAKKAANNPQELRRALECNYGKDHLDQEKILPLIKSAEEELVKTKKGRHLLSEIGQTDEKVAELYQKVIEKETKKDSEVLKKALESNYGQKVLNPKEFPEELRDL